LEPGGPLELIFSIKEQAPGCCRCLTEQLAQQRFLRFPKYMAIWRIWDQLF